MRFSNAIRAFHRADILAGAALLAFSSVAWGQTALDTDANSKTDATPPEEIEEIVVVGEKSLLVMQKEVERAADNVFDTFNVLNTDPEFDIRCEKRAQVGTRIKQRICRPQFEYDIEAEYAEKFGDAMNQGGLASQNIGMSAGAGSAKILSRKKILDEKMAAMAMENPELGQALVNLVLAERKYEAERKRRCDGRVICSK